MRMYLNTVIHELVFFEQGNNALISFEHMPVHKTAIVSDQSFDCEAHSQANSLMMFSNKPPFQ